MSDATTADSPSPFEALLLDALADDCEEQSAPALSVFAERPEPVRGQPQVGDEEGYALIDWLSKRDPKDDSDLILRRVSDYAARLVPVTRSAALKAWSPGARRNASDQRSALLYLVEYQLRRDAASLKELQEMLLEISLRVELPRVSSDPGRRMDLICTHIAPTAEQAIDQLKTLTGVKRETVERWAGGASTNATNNAILDTLSDWILQVVRRGILTRFELIELFTRPEEGGSQTLVERIAGTPLYSRPDELRSALCKIYCYDQRAGAEPVGDPGCDRYPVGLRAPALNASPAGSGDGKPPDSRPRWGTLAE